MPSYKTFYNPKEKRAIVCDWDWVRGTWRCNGGEPYQKLCTHDLDSLRVRLQNDGYEETQWGPDAA